jgi:hypothetical protein
MRLVSIARSPRPGKKWRATFEHDGREKHTDFGDSTMKDYTQSKDQARAVAYRSRHAKDLDTGDPTRAGYLSYYVLWAGTNMASNIRAYKHKFNL